MEVLTLKKKSNFHPLLFFQVFGHIQECKQCSPMHIIIIFMHIISAYNHIIRADECNIFEYSLKVLYIILSMQGNRLPNRRKPIN